MANIKTRGTSKLLAFVMALLMTAYGMFQTMPALADEGGDAKQEQVASTSPSDAPRSEDKEDEQQDGPSAKQGEESKTYGEEDEQEDSLDGDKEKANAPPAKADGEKSNPIDDLRRSLGGVVRAESTGNVSIPVTVSWTDNDNEAGERPSTLTYVLYALENGSIVKKATQTGAPTTGYTFSGMPERGDDGNLIVYYVAVSPITNYYITASSNSQDAISVPEGHAWSFVKALGDTSVNFIMTYGEPMMVDFTVIVEWDDEGAEDQRPDSVPFVIRRDGATEGDDLVLTSADEGTSEHTLSGDFNDSWVRTIQVYGKKGNAPAFIGDYSYYQVDHPELDGYYLDNMAARYAPGTESNGKTIWIYRYKKSADTVSVFVQKNWNDNDDAAGNRPERVVVGVYANGDMTEPVQTGGITASSSNSWAGIFKLPKNDDQGNPITYTVDEMYVPWGYTKEVTGSMADGFTITNTIIGDIDVPVQVVWNDQDNLSGDRPSSVYIRLYESDKDPSTSSPAAQHSVGADEETPWRRVFTVPEKKQDGSNISYVVVAPDNSCYEKEVTGNMTDGFVVTYTLKAVCEATHVPVSVVWNDDNDAAGRRPSSVHLSINPSADHRYGNHGFGVNLNEEKSWAHTFVVPKNGLDGMPLTYTLNAGDIPSGYTREVSGDQNEGFVVTYTIEAEAPEVEDPEVETVNITVEKTWDDDNDAYGVRPDSISLSLGRWNGHETAEVATATLNKEDATIDQDGNRWVWHNVFAGDNLPRFDQDGNEIEYDFLEDTDGHYACDDITRTTDPVTYHLTNRYVPPLKRSIEVHKVWDDEGYESARPESVTVRLLSDGDEIDSAVLSEENQWRHTFLADLYTEKEDGTYYAAYDVVEDAVEGYKSAINLRALDEYSSATRYLFTITNTRITDEKTKHVVVNKVWDDDNDAKGKRPDHITVRLLADGKAINSVQLNKETNWSCEFSGLPVYNEEGNEIYYDVAEDLVEGYSASTQKRESDDGDTLTYTLTNSLIKVAEPEQPSKKDIPQLGDTSGLTVACAVIVASFVGAFLALKRRN